MVMGELQGDAFSPDSERELQKSRSVDRLMAGRSDFQRNCGSRGSGKAEHALSMAAQSASSKVMPLPVSGTETVTR